MTEQEILESNKPEFMHAKLETLTFAEMIPEAEQRNNVLNELFLLEENNLPELQKIHKKIENIISLH